MSPPDSTGPGASGRSDVPLVREAYAAATARHRPISPADQAAFAALVEESLAAARSMAAAWRTGLTALITLVTTGVILTGRTAATTLSVSWRVAVTVAIGGGLALAVAGLWNALAAEAGARIRMHTLDDIRGRYASVQAYQVGRAAAIGRRLNTARTLVAFALGLLLTGVLLTWWAPAAPASPPSYLEVTLRSGTVCGTLKSADGGTLRLSINGAYEPAVIPLTAVRNLAVTPACP